MRRRYGLADLPPSVTLNAEGERRRRLELAERKHQAAERKVARAEKAHAAPETLIPLWWERTQTLLTKNGMATLDRKLNAKTLPPDAKATLRIAWEHRRIVRELLRREAKRRARRAG